jgi:hypothetical protein
MDISVFWFQYPNTAPCFIGSDNEWDGNQPATGVGIPEWDSVCGTATGNGTGGSGALDLPFSTSSANTYGRLITGDGISKFSGCGYYGAGSVPGLPATSFKSCVQQTVCGGAGQSACADTTIFTTNNMFVYIVGGPLSPGPKGGFGGLNWIVTSATDYFERITVWECENYKVAACITNPVISTHP